MLYREVKEKVIIFVNVNSFYEFGVSLTFNIQAKVIYSIINSMQFYYVIIRVPTLLVLSKNSDIRIECDMS